MLIERNISGCKLRVECAEGRSRMATSVLQVFERLAASGKPLRSGMQVRFGTSLLRLSEESGDLRVVEPDFEKWPALHWQPTIDITLDISAAQTTLLRQLSVDAEDAWFDQYLIAVHGALQEREIFLRRRPSDMPEDSGWLLGTSADPQGLTRSGSLERMSIAQVIARRFALVQVLVLPREFVVTFSGDSLQQVYDAGGRVLRGPKP